jgi:hypothetical protein
MVADVGAVTTVTEGAAANALLVAALVLVVLIRQTVHRDLSPVVDILDLENRRCETLTLTRTVFLRESNAEVANAGVVEILTSTNEADIPASTFRIVFFLAVVTFD